MHINDKSNYKTYIPKEDRYQKISYNRSGKSGVLLPAISLGLWHNFGKYDHMANAEAILRTAFDHGITHFDLANNYGPPYGSAEESFGLLYKQNFKSYRNELFIATKAGYDMWPGPYGNHGSRKYLISSIDESLQRMNLEYVDLFYHHRPDPNTPLEETAIALYDIVRQGKALYVGVSRYNTDETNEMAKLLKELKVPFIIHQSRYSLFDRSIENNLLTTLAENKLGCIAFSPLAQGLLTDKYISRIPENSRALKSKTYLDVNAVEEKLPVVKKLNAIAQNRGQKLHQMAISWLLNQKGITSVLVGVSSPNQLEENIKATHNTLFSEEEIKQIHMLTHSFK
ncbi:aldo/keto reductase [Tenacibaculum agarivorans]|uniref:aldo/keto reductase n=1 Tax=Tenacibaculum agarivorans TaxID=1908389 RepID=UPI00094BA2D8|nr:aldo/keto reductase [Tenacibaculum agarivorans]